jgi:hypothetical protein
MNEQLKPFKTVEEIAKKHRLDVSFIEKQLKMGKKIEHEHTKNHTLARDIALQHLDEIPDYYTRLKKMEADAKKHHKKFKDVKEATDGIKARDYKGRLDRWFDDGGWVQTGGKYDGKPCARQPGQTTKPYCRDPDDRAAMSKDERNKRAAKKRREDPNPNESGKAKMVTQEAAGEKDACYHKVKSRYKKWPSAYASGALVKCRKVGAANWGTKSESVDAALNYEWDGPIRENPGRYCPKCEKVESRDECKYGQKYWDMFSLPSEVVSGKKDYNVTMPNIPESKDEEYSMVRGELKTIENAVKRLRAKVGKGEGNLEAWVQSKITKAADYIDTAADYIASGEMDESIGFEIDSSAHKMARKREKIRTLSSKGVGGEKEVASKKLGATAELPKINKEETLVDKITKEVLDEKCWTGYKRKKGTTEFAKGSCVKAENVTIEDADGNTFAEVVDLIKPEPIKGFKSQVSEATRLQAQTGNVIAVTLSWRGKYYSMKMFFPQIKTPSRKEINDELQKVYPGSMVVYHSVSEIQPGQPLIQAFGPQGGSAAKPGPSKNYVKTMGEEVEIDEASPAWQRKEGKNPEGGLNARGRASAKEQGHNLKPPVTTPPSKLDPDSKAAKRRKSFCARMGGMPGPMKDEKGRPTRKALSLRKWNCN